MELLDDSLDMAGSGPNKVFPSSELYTSNISDPVRLKIPKNGGRLETMPPISVPELLKRTATEYPNHPALCFKDSEQKWQTITYRDYEEQVKICAKAFIQLGLERHHSVCILGYNSPEWIIAKLGAIFAGGIAAGIYTTNSSAACLHCAKRGRANIIVVQDAKQLDKIKEIRDKLPLLKAVVQYEGEPSDPNVLSWKQLMEIGKNQSDHMLNNVLEQIAINECCILIYTSGTVGEPKAVMLNHDNVTWNAFVVAEHTSAGKGTEHIISFLPLSHVAAQMIDVYTAITIAATIHFADKNALKGSLLTTMQEVRPTYFVAVPRVWEKIYQKMTEIGSKSGVIKKTISNWAKFYGLQHNMNKINGIGRKQSDAWGYTFARWLVFKRIKEGLGLDRCTIMVSAAAPIASDIKQYFLSLDMPIMECYGLSEVSGPHTLGIISSYNLPSVGPTMPGIKTKILAEKGETSGEICCYGRHIFMGYLDEPLMTSEAIDEDGWLHTGDLGCVDEQGFLYITGRSKELLITAGGENIPPLLIEQMVQKELPYISNAILIGDQRKFLTILLSLKTEVDAEGLPLDDLTSDVKEWLGDLGCPADTVTKVLSDGPDARLVKAIQNGIDKANEYATSNAQRIQKFAILPADFSIATGELGPTLKLRRNVVVAKYGNLIDKLYV